MVELLYNFARRPYKIPANGAAMNQYYLEKFHQQYIRIGSVDIARSHLEVREDSLRYKNDPQGYDQLRGLLSVSAVAVARGVRVDIQLASKPV